MLNDDAMRRDIDATQTKTESNSRIAVLLFPALILLGGVAGVLVPHAFSGLSSWINPLLMIIMFAALGFGVYLLYLAFGGNDFLGIGEPILEILKGGVGPKIL